MPNAQHSWRTAARAQLRLPLPILLLPALAGAPAAFAADGANAPLPTPTDASAAAAPATSATTDGPLAKAQAAWVAGDTRAAVVRLKLLLERDPEDAAARLLLTRVALDSGEGRVAEQEARRARQAGADPAQVLPVLAEALLIQERYGDVLTTIAVPADAGPGLRAALLAAQGQAQLGQQNLAAADALFAQAQQAVADLPQAAVGRAMVLAAGGKLDEARAALTRFGEQQPNTDLVWQALGKLEFATGHPAAAVDAYTRAIANARLDWPLIYQRALAYADATNVDAVRADLAAIEEQVPEFPGLDYLRGWLRLRDGQPTAALEALEVYLQRAPDDPRGNYFAALALYQTDRNAQAEDYLVRLQQRAPGNATVATLMALNRLASNDADGAVAVLAPFEGAGNAPADTLGVLRRALVAAGRPVDAQRVLEQLVARFPDLTGATLLLAEERQKQGDVAGATSLLQGLLAKEPDNAPANRLLIRALLQAGDNDGALAAAEALLARQPEAALALTLQGAVLAARGDQDGAQKAFGEALARDPGYAGAAMGLAAMALGKGDDKAARQTLDNLLDADPANTQGWLALAGLDARESGPEASLKRLREAVQANPKDLALRLSAAQVLLQEGQAAAVLDLLREAPADQADRPALLLLSARAESANGNPGGAATILNRLADAHPNAPELRYMLAMVSIQAGNRQEAEAQVIKGLELDRNQVLTATQLNTLLAAAASLDDRKALLARLARIAPEHFQLRLALANQALATGDTAAALERFQALREEFPQRADIAVGLASALRASDQIPDALSMLGQWIDAHPKDVQARLLRAEIALAEGRLPGAIADYRGALAADAEQPSALNNLAMLIAEDSPNEALALAERGVKLRPKDPMYLDTLGFVLLQANEPERAREVLAQAHAATTDPGVAFNYATALAATGDRAGARAVLLAIVGADFPAKAKAAELLDRLGK